MVVSNYRASAGVGARAAEHAVELLARDWSSSLPPANQCIKYVPGLKALHRTAFSPLRCVKAAVYAGVMRLYDATCRPDGAS